MKKKNIEDLHRISVETFKSTKKKPLVMILDNVRSLHNVGSVFRTSDAYLVEKIFLCGITAVPPSAEIHKTALGAEDTVQWEYAENTVAVVTSLKANGYTVLAIEQVEGSVSLNDFAIDNNRKYAVILGNEVKGVQQSVVDQCDACIELPQFGTKHSLNVSVTAGIVIWEFSKQMQ
ncbi:MAG: RNA methyltransferase [Paludibacteraceae bacterium]|nr:RNA methyltransferase [Paludibacteraceae bacterium]